MLKKNKRQTNKNKKNKISILHKVFTVLYYKLYYCTQHIA